MVSQNLASISKSKQWEYAKNEGMDHDNEGILRLKSCFEDETGLLDTLFHRQMEDYEIFQPSCHMLEITEWRSDT